MINDTRNLALLSTNKDFKQCISEWYFADHVIDHGKPTQTCQLCNHHGVRYHFLIKNKTNSHYMYVGSDCLLKFGVEVKEDGVKLNKEEAKDKLYRLEQDARKKHCIKVLDKLALSEKNDILKNALIYYKENSYLSPKMAFVVMWRLQEHKIDHHPSFFKIYIKTERYKKDLLEMPFGRISVIYPALSDAQIKLLPNWMVEKIKNEQQKKP